IVNALPQDAPISVSQELPPHWQPPTARARGKGPFAPRPREGHNIFKGEAAQWLADTIEAMRVDGELLNNPAVINYISQIGQYVAKYSVTPETNYKFIVTDNEEPNATSIGNGKIYLSLGLLRLMENEDELAGVLAHEMAHDSYSHVAKTITR